MRIGYLLSNLFFNIFLISPKVSSYLFWGAKSTLVMITKNGIFKNRHKPMCYLVIFCSPMFAPTTTHPKSLYYHIFTVIVQLIHLLSFLNISHAHINPQGTQFFDCAWPLPSNIYFYFGWISMEQLDGLFNQIPLFLDLLSLFFHFLVHANSWKPLFWQGHFHHQAYLWLGLILGSIFLHQHCQWCLVSSAFDGFGSLESLLAWRMEMLCMIYLWCLNIKEFELEWAVILNKSSILEIMYWLTKYPCFNS